MTQMSNSGIIYLVIPEYLHNGKVSKFLENILMIVEIYRIDGRMLSFWFSPEFIKFIVLSSASTED